MTTASLINVDRACHEVRCGRPVAIDKTGFIQPEYVDEKTFKKIKTRNARLIITANRAKALFGKNFSGNQQIDLQNLNFDDLQALTSPTGHQSHKNFITSPATGKVVEAALELARIAQLLPCAILFNTTESAFKATSSQILKYSYSSSESLEPVAEAPLKLCDAKNSSIKAFRSKNGAAEHMALIIGKPGAEPLVRIHSSCYTGDLLGSLACDCGDQLRGAIKLMDQAGGGILIYLMQEGRGIGLTNKLHTYELQAKGLDTVEANEFLGFDDEERSFEAAATILKKLNIKKLKLITNNPKKINALQKLGIKVNGRVPLVIKHEHNHFYLEVKSTKSGHIIS